MQHSRQRRGNSFQERGSGGRFTSSQRGRGGYDDYRDYDRRNEGRRNYGYSEDYPQGRYQGGYDEGWNENEDQYRDRYNDYDGREEGYTRRGYESRGGNGYYNSGYDTRNYNPSGYDDQHGGWEREDRGRNRWDREARNQNGWGNGNWNHDDWRSGSSHTSRAGSNHRGFETMPRSEVRRIAAMGGRASHEGGNSRRSRRVSDRRRSRSSR